MCYALHVVSLYSTEGSHRSWFDVFVMCLVQHEESSGHKNYSTDNDMNHKIENVTLSPSGNVHEENTDNGGGHRRKLLAGISWL